jgi:hypothetical protein
MKVSAVAMPVVVPPNVKEVAVRTLPVAVEAAMVAAGMSSGPVAATTSTAIVREARFAAWFTPEGDESPVSALRVHAFTLVAAALMVITTFAVAVPPLAKALVPAVLASVQPACLAHAGEAAPEKLGSTRVILSLMAMS